jgi:phospholipid/cholesterol/gamma-HCH transport system substrate-binding protein
VVNVVSAGRSQVALVPGQVIQGIESSFFDPILEQVGLGPVERNHLSHTIAEVRDTVDALGPRLRSILGSLDETSTMVRQTVEEAKPKLSETTAHLEQISARLDDPKVTQLIGQLQSLTGEINSFLTENRPKVAGTLDSAQSIARQVDQAIADERPRMSQLVTDLEGTRKRVDHVLVNAETITSQGASILTTNRGQIDRVLANVNLASDYGLKLVQKIFANPFYLSPFYKPTPADVEAQAVYDATTAFMDGAKEFNDAVKTLQAMQGRPMTELEKKSYNDLYIRAWKILPTLQVSQSQLSDRMRASSRR